MPSVVPGGIRDIYDSYDRHGFNALKFPNILERSLRIAMTLAYLIKLIAPLSRKVVWVTDRDSIVNNPKCTTQMLHLLDHCSITISDDINRKVEVYVHQKNDIDDFMSVADLIAGASARMLTDYYDGEIPLKPGLNEILSLLKGQGILFRSFFVRINSGLDGDIVSFRSKDSILKIRF